MVASYRSIFAAAALVVASTAGAGAADLYGGPGMKDMPAAYAPSPSWYVRGDYTYSWMDSGDLWRSNASFEQSSIDNTQGFGGGIGRYFGRGVRGDVTYEWRGATDVVGGGLASTAFDVKSSVLLANLYYDFRAGERLTPYVGVGVGAARHDVSGGTILSTCGGTPCTYGGEKDWTPAAALMAGFSFRFDRHSAPVSIKDDGYAGAGTQPGRLHLDVGYRFLYLGDAHAGDVVGVANATPGPRLEDITAHEIRVGLRWDIR